MMKTPQQIKEEYINKARTYAEKMHEKSKISSTGEVRDRTNEIYVTDICVATTWCKKKVYYNKISPKPTTVESILRMQIGNLAHEIPLWDDENPDKNGHERAFFWNGLKARFDEIDMVNGIILDKKTVASMPTKPKEYVTKQLNIYRVMAEDNEEKPVKINQLYALNINVNNGNVEVQEIPMWEKQKAIDFVNKAKAEIEEMIKTKTVPDVAYQPNFWFCDGCEHKQQCIVDTPGGASSLGTNTRKENTPSIELIHKTKKQQTTL